MPSVITHWLVKTEPESFSIDDFLDQPRKTTCWSGVRNYQARNYMRDGMKLGHSVLIYHSNAEPSAIVGLAKVVKEAYADFTAWDASDSHYDPASPPENPRWMMVDLQFVKKFSRELALNDLRAVTSLKNMELLRKGSRLSVQPVSATEFATILRLTETGK
jgi:predicted RNA-binding protein with PUA-like domain